MVKPTREPAVVAKHTAAARKPIKRGRVAGANPGTKAGPKHPKQSHIDDRRVDPGREGLQVRYVALAIATAKLRPPKLRRLLQRH